MIIDISSYNNSRYKFLKSLEKSRKRKNDGVFVMEGRPEIDIAISQGLKPELVIFTESYISYEEILSLGISRNCEFLRLSKPLFDELSYQHVPNNFMVVFKSWFDEFTNLDSNKPIVVLESIEKPGNLGAILRTCDAAGIDQLIVSESDIDRFNPNVLRNSRGAAFSVCCVFSDNASTLNYLKRNDYFICAAAISEIALDYRSIVYNSKIAMVFGPESSGLSQLWLDNADQFAIVPMKGKVDSLNVSVSAALIIYHAAYEISKNTIA